MPEFDAEDFNARDFNTPSRKPCPHACLPPNFPKHAPRYLALQTTLATQRASVQGRFPSFKCVTLSKQSRGGARFFDARGDNPSTVRFPKSEHHRDFIQATIDEEVTKRWVSSGSAFPLPGVTYNSIFVVESANHRMRVVADHTSSGLNDGIQRSDCPTVYDTIIDFIRLLRWHRFSSKLLTGNSVLWKLDVSSAFKILIMSKRWQARLDLYPAT
ncbi:BQ5605_C008g04900 [Microbotryum silenes-dioicae]|uniref:BQ5605_C008g04900 protein n=1 Tax=Microbotryum silenes-dioicae TaxID=796604 RepID=A0A2X0MFS3_9BASI|nr:BQ5605_C008g04900 [Microbotryum silenes-dioicae]